MTVTPVTRPTVTGSVPATREVAVPPAVTASRHLVAFTNPTGPVTLPPPPPPPSPGKNARDMAAIGAGAITIALTGIAAAASQVDPAAGLGLLGAVAVGGGVTAVLARRRP